MLKKGMNAEKTKYLIIERKVIKMVATVATKLEIHGGFYFTQPDNVVMFDETLSQTAKVVYCNLLSHVKKGTNRCKLYISTIAEEVKRSVRTVRRALSQLCERGIIVRFMQYGNKQNQLASLFVIIGKNAACYQDTSHQVRQSALAEANNVNAGNTLEENTAQGVPSETKTESLPKVSAPHAKNGRQNNNKCDNKSLLKDTLIGQAELPKSSSSLRKKLEDDYETAQILIDFDAQEEQKLHEPHEHQKTQEAQEKPGQKGRLTDLHVAECPNGNKADEHNNIETSDKINDAETVIETVIAPEANYEDLLISEKVETNGNNADNSPNNDADSDCTFDPLAYVQDADKIPNDMLDTARYFLYRTGRDPRTINEKEIQAMREVFINHYPARIQKEIDTACRRFVQNGKSLNVLFFGYITAALRRQKSFVPFEKKLAKHGEDGNIKASRERETSQLSEGHRYLTSEDISDKTNPLSSMSIEELLALEKEIDGKMKKS